MIAGPSPHAVEVGKEIARRGGNVVDVAIGVELSLAVTHPYYGSLGGGGLALVRMGEKTEALDFRETAPSAVDSSTFKGKGPETSVDGGLAVAIPGIPAGLWALHQRYGKLPWPTLFASALRLAERGFEVSGEWVKNTNDTKARFNPAGLKYFFRAKGVGLKPGDTLKQPKLARALKAFSKNGPKGFYEGSVARDLVSTVRQAGGAITEADLRGYKVRWLEPLTANVEGYKFFLMPPPSSGGVVLSQALRLIEKLKLKEKKSLSVDELHLLAEIMKLTYRSRMVLGDPDFVKNPLSQLLSQEYIDSLAQLIDLKTSVRIEPLAAPQPEHEQTTHFSVMDGAGNAVAMTITLNGTYGSAVVTDRFGIALNNEIDDFTTHPGQPNQYGLIQGEANLVRPGARPLSSMSPTLVEKSGRVILTVGSPGGPKIISAVLQVIYRNLLQDFDIDQAIQAPRVHHQFLPDVVMIDARKFSPDVLDLLTARGHRIEPAMPAKVYGVRRKDDGLLSGAFDSRGEGAAGGF